MILSYAANENLSIFGKIPLFTENFVILHSVMSALHTLRQTYSSRLERLHTVIVEALSSDNPLMSRVIEHYMSHRGKQLRPLLAMITADMLGETPCYDVTPAAAAIEMLHNASLIHDDVVDASDVRHGVPTINAIWDNHIAVLAGDYFVSRALSLSASTADFRVIETLAGLGAQLSLGEMSQIHNAREHSLTEEGYFSIITRKTASLFRACVEVGAYSVGVTDRRLDLLRRYADIFGQCFQITDDIFDYTPSATLGKPTGNDLREGKVTLPLLCALDSGDREATEMRSKLMSDSLTDSDIATLMEFTHRAGGIEAARAKLAALRNEGEAIARAIAPHSEPNPLVTFLDYVVAREN